MKVLEQFACPSLVGKGNWAHRLNNIQYETQGSSCQIRSAF
jgi:hypothetical protein